MAYAQERQEWSRFFKQAEARGTIIVVDARNMENAVFIHNGQRAEARFSPASTFKIPHSLFALDAHLLHDEFDVIAWDGVSRAIPTWNANQTLRSAMRNSTVWVYEKFAAKLGAQRMQDYLRRIQYGNMRTSGGKPFWIEGDLAISAEEQIAFLRHLYANKLAFPIEHQRLVKDVMINEAGSDWILRAKTGWTGTIGWWVGWVERTDGPVFFALNIDTPGRLADLAKRQEIGRKILASINALPEIY
ncbi:MAG: class D beta-lactamase [Pseudomonadota bacterium]